MIQKTVLDNGLTILTEKKDSDFITVQYYVQAGAIDEKDDELGLAHLCEHMVFKGTVNRTNEQINMDIERLGGIINAWTNYYETTFYTTMLKEHWLEGFDVISDVVFNATIPEEEFEREKAVVIEELTMYNDEGPEIVSDLLRSTIFGDKHKSWWNVGGAVESVKKLDRDILCNWIDKYYVPENMYLLVCGDIDHQEIADLVADYIKNLKFGTLANKHKVISINDIHLQDSSTKINQAQAHIAFCNKVPLADQHTALLESIITTALGTGLGSRLSTELREKLGYCYTIELWSEVYQPDNISLFSGYMGLNKENISKAKKRIIEVLDEASKNGLTPIEFEKAINTMKFSLKAKNITTSDILAFIVQQLTLGYSYNIDEIVKEIDTITREEVNEFMKKYLKADEICFAEAIPSK